MRLFPEIHGAVLEELARVPCGSRSARVIHLLTIGLIYEHACGSARVSQASVSSPSATDAVGPDTVGMRSDDLTFVSALITFALSERFYVEFKIQSAAHLGDLSVGLCRRENTETLSNGIGKIPSSSPYGGRHQGFFEFKSVFFCGFHTI